MDRLGSIVLMGDCKDGSLESLSEELDTGGGLDRKVLRLPRLNVLPTPSDCLLNAANSGFWSTGMTAGEKAAVDRTAEEGGLQFCLAC